MKVVFIVRSTLFTAKGGDSVQISATARHLAGLGVSVDIKLTNEAIDYSRYDLLHFFNITRPADILYHISKSRKPFVLSPILVDYSEYDKYHRKGISGIVFRFLPANTIEYLKTIARWLLGRDKLVSRSYIWKGHRRSVLQILQQAALILPNSRREYEQLVQQHKVNPDYIIVPNGVDTDLFTFNHQAEKDRHLVLCVARVEGIKNQINLIKALNNTYYRVMIIGSPALNQSAYYRTCKKIAADNILFVDQLSQEELVPYYQKAKVHIQPSWFETCGLSTLEAGITGCNVVVTHKGYTDEYYENFAFYCDPGSPESIRNAVEKAMASDYPEKFREKISRFYTWSNAARLTFEAYKQVAQKAGKLRIGILGTRGIPNHYGGFEQITEHLSRGLSEKGHELTVYNSHNHPYQQKKWKNVQLMHCYDPEFMLGTFGQFIYDLNCILDARKKQFDVILMLGYTSSSIWGWLFPRNSTVIFNMDGLEWKRSKYSRPVQQFLFYAEKLAVKFGDYHIADSHVIQAHLRDQYRIPCKHVAYGAEIFANEDESLLKEYRLDKYDYFILMARMEPENNIETILEGFSTSRSTKKLIVIGNTQNKFGKHLLHRFQKDRRIQFIGAIYDDAQKIHSLRAFSYLYFHGHSVGGTNPSLLEAMASGSLIAAHHNPFNKAILNEDAYYFVDSKDVRHIVELTERGSGETNMIRNNLRKIQDEYTWRKIIDKYEAIMLNRFAVKSAHQ